MDLVQEAGVVKARITLTFALDEDYIAAEAVRRGKPADVIAREVISDLECRTFDCCRWRDGVDHLGVKADVLAPARV